MLPLPSPPPLPSAPCPSTRWYEGMVVPTILLWACALIVAAIPLLGAHIPEGAANSVGLQRVAFGLAISIWVTADARKRRRALPYDYDSFMFFAWPLLGPIYLWQTRRWRAGLTLLWFILLLTVVVLGDLVWWWRA